MSAFALDDAQLERYSRNILLKEVGPEGQARIMAGRVLVVGAGGLGAPVALYLAAAGVGTLGLVDMDRVDLSNLQRQVIHFTADVGRLKTESAAAKLADLNPGVRVVAIPERLDAANAGRILGAGWDFVVDGTDNFAAKFLINDACVLAGLPYSHGGILRFEGQTMTVDPRRSACYRCAFHAPPPKGAVPTCSQAGVLGAVAGMLGTIQAAESLKWLARAGTPLTDALLSFDALEMRFRRIALRRSPTCPVCGDAPSITTLRDEEQPVCDLRTGCKGGSCG